MKHIAKTILFSSTLLLSTQAISYGGIWKDSSGNNVTDGFGDCLIYGTFSVDQCNTMDAGMDKGMMANSMDKSEEPVVKEVINLKGVTFKTDSDELNASSNDRLDQGVADLKANPDIKVIVAGHTDNSGDSLYNLDLSQKRAETVRQYLIDNGIEASRLTARGYGETEPMAPNDTANGRAQNRRVELRILE